LRFIASGLIGLSEKEHWVFPEPFVVDQQIELRLLYPQNIGMHYALLEANRDHIAVWEDWAHYATFESQEQYLRMCLDRYYNHTGFAAGIWFRAEHTPAHQYAGIISARTEFPRSSELGYWLSRQFTGRGITTRAVKVVTRHLLLETSANRVLLAIATGNTASRAVAERAGFKLDGILRQDAMLQGTFIDRAIYTMIANDLETARR
jgi:ribosomal-protein-serine acetyltransferase